MNIFKKSKTAKVLAVVAGVAAGFTMTVGVAQAALTDDQVDAIVALLESFGADSATINNVQVALTGEGETVATPGACVPYTFSRNLTVGDTGEDVKALQVLLNTDVATQVAATGIGSAGEESEYFGSLTKAAVVKFQDLYAADVLTPIGLTAGTGYVGSMTLAKLNELSTCEADDTADVTGFGTAATFTLSGTPVASDYIYITLTDAENVVQCAADVLSAPTGVTLNSLTDSLTTKFGNCPAISASSVGNVITVVTTGASFKIDVDVDKASGSTLNIVGAITEAGDDTADDTTVGESMTVEALEQPALSVVPSSSTGVPVFNFRMTGSVDTDVTVNSLVITRQGPGGTADISAVYLYEGDTRLTTGRTVNSSTHQANFTGLNLLIPAGTSKDLTVKVDANSGRSGTHQFVIVNAASISATAEFGGSYPIAGASYAYSSTDVGAVTVARTGSLTNPKVGEANAKVAEFRLTASSAENVNVSKIALYSIGSISTSNISNFVLKRSGDDTVLATATGIDSKNTVTMVLDTPYLLEKGSSKIFEVYADVSGAARKDDTIRLYVDNDSDLEGIGAIYGYGVGVTRGDYDNGDANGDDASYTTVEGGQITNVFEGPATKDISTNSNDVELFRYTMTSQSNVEIRSTGVKLTAANVAGAADGLVDTSPAGTANDVVNYTDVKIVDVATGVTVAGPTDLTVGTDSGSGTDLIQTITYTDYYNMTAGQSRTFKVTADVANNSSATIENDTLRVDLVAFGGSSIKNIDNNQFVSTADIVPSSAVTGNTHNIKRPGLTLAISSTPTSQTYIKGSSFSVLGINLKAGTGGDIKVTAMTIQTYVDTDLTGDLSVGADATTSATDNILQANLWDGTTQVGTTKSPTVSSGAGTGGVLSFTSLNYTVPAGTTKTLVLKVITPSSAATSSRVKFGIALTTHVTAQDVEGNSVDASGDADNDTTSGTDGVILTIADTGSLTAVKAADDTESETSIVVAGGSNVVLGKYRFTAQNEELKVTKAQIDLVTATNYASVISLQLYDGASSVSSAVNMDSSGIVSFNDVNFIVPKDSSKTLTVKAVLNTISGGAVSGADLAVELEDDNFEARGTESSTVLTSSDVTLDIDGNEKVIRKTKMTIEKVTTSSTIVNNSEQDLYKFKVTADSAEDTALRQMVFNMTLTDNQGTPDTLSVANLKLLRNGVDVTTQVCISASSTLGVGTDLENASYTEAMSTSTGRVVVAFGNLTGEEIITKGTSNTYTLRGTPTGFVTGADNDSISVELLTDSVAQTTGHTYILDSDTDASAGVGDIIIQLSDNAAADSVANIIWSDYSAIPHYSAVADDGATTSSASNDWINGYLLKSMPIGASSMNN